METIRLNSNNCVELSSAQMELIMTHSDLFADFIQWYDKRSTRFAAVSRTKVFLSYVLSRYYEPSANTLAHDRIAIRGFCKGIAATIEFGHDFAYFCDYADEPIYSPSDFDSDESLVDRYIDSEDTDLPF